MTFSGVIFNLSVPTRFACLVGNFSDICLRTAFVLYPTFRILAYALRLSCTSIKAFFKGFNLAQAVA